MRLRICFLALIIFVAITSAYENYASRTMISSMVSAPLEWKKIARASIDEKLSFVIALKQNNLDLLKDKFHRVSDPQSDEYGMYLSKEQINQIVAPSRSVYEKFIEWFRAHGLVLDTDYTIEGDAILVTASIDQIERLFQTHLYSFKKNAKMIHRVLGAYSMPTDLHEHISFVSGLTNFPVRTQEQIHKTKRQAVQGAVQVPYSIKKQYNMPQNLRATSPKNSQSVVQFVNSHAFSMATLEEYQKYNNLPNATVTTLGPFAGEELESVLDIQFVTGIGVGVPTLFWTLEDWIYELSVKLSAMNSPPLVVSISWDADERDICSSSMQPYDCAGLKVDNQTYIDRVNTEFMKNGLRGVTLLVASGDSGAPGTPGCDGSNPLNPFFPASSPYVTSVGSTFYYNPQSIDSTKDADAPPICSLYNCTHPAYENSAIWSGGGFAIYSPMPKYQSAAVKQFLMSGGAPDRSLFNPSNRAYPDISTNGHNFLVRLNGQWNVLDGTSGSAPVVAGMLAMINDYLLNNNRPPLGFFNPLLYQMLQQSSSAFTDITGGNNFCTIMGTCCQTGFSATAGWDAVTGVGTPNFANMFSYIQSLSNK